MAIYTTNNKIWKLNNKWVAEPYVDPYNPLNLPINTIRCKLISGYTPNMGDTQTLVDSTNNIWDIYKESNNWSSIRPSYNNYLLEVLGANTTNVTNMFGLFTSCNQLTTVALFDTSNVNDMSWMFAYCDNLTTIPLFNTSKATNMTSMFYNCTHVNSGALALYQQASSQAIPPTNHNQTFYKCGSNTQTGTAELAQIPSDWK